MNLSKLYTITKKRILKFTAAVFITGLFLGAFIFFKTV